MGESQSSFAEWGKACQMILLMILAMVTPLEMEDAGGIFISVFESFGHLLSRIFNLRPFFLWEFFPDFPRFPESVGDPIPPCPAQ